MSSGPTAKIRLVRCPSCQQVLLESPDVPFYECGGCGTHLRGKTTLMRHIQTHVKGQSSLKVFWARPYHVFLSFRGEDTRNGFTSHLHEALSSSQISTFIDNNLRRGDNISPSLLTKIEESMISVIIFSENYANSRWCLKELVKILRCRELNGQIVIPVFYGVDPSHVRKQIGKFGVAFDKLKERLQEGEMDLEEVRYHLEQARNISG